jgi:hypothetical protein
VDLTLWSAVPEEDNMERITKAGFVVLTGLVILFGWWDAAPALGPYAGPMTCPPVGCAPPAPTYCPPPVICAPPYCPAPIQPPASVFVPPCARPGLLATVFGGAIRLATGAIGTGFKVFDSITTRPRIVPGPCAVPGPGY